MKFAIILALLFVVTQSCSFEDEKGNQSGIKIRSVDTFGGSKNESARAITKTTDGGYAVLGFTQSRDGDITNKTNESYDYWLLKFDANSRLQWQSTYGGTDDDRGSDLIQTYDGGYAIIGYSKSNDLDVLQNFGAQDFWLVKLNNEGTPLWQKTFGFSGADNGISIIQTNEGGFLITGVLDVSASGGEGASKIVRTKRHAGGDFWVLKTDRLGNIEWSRFYGGSLTETPYDVIQTSNNNYLIVGSTDSNDVDISTNKGGYDFWVVKISETGNLIWEKSFGGSQIDEARAIAPSNDGHYLIIGDTRSDDLEVSKNNGAADLWLIKISTEGALIWEKSFGGSSFDSGRSIFKTQDNGFVISGSSRSVNGDVDANKGQNDAWLIKIDSQANIMWSQTIGGTEIDFTFDATELDNSSIIAVGESKSIDHDITENKGFSDLLIINIDD